MLYIYIINKYIYIIYIIFSICKTIKNKSILLQYLGISQFSFSDKFQKYPLGLEAGRRKDGGNNWLRVHLFLLPWAVKASARSSHSLVLWVWLGSSTLFFPFPHDFGTSCSYGCLH